jgi:hypothetical protein
VLSKKKKYRDTEGGVVAEELLDLRVDVTLRAQRPYPLYHYLQCGALSFFFFGCHVACAAFLSALYALPLPNIYIYIYIYIYAV